MRAPTSELPIVLQDVSVVVRGLAVLDQVSLELAPGAPTVLIGPNGAGKTTLLRLAMGLIPPARGRLTWAGREKTRPLRRAMVFQRPVMLRRSTAGNLGYALAAAGVPRAERAARLHALLARVGLAGLAQRPARKLSGGEQQKLALARALASDPQVLFLDEPTASLDPAATQAVEDIIGAAAASGIKVVMATHDLGEARRLAGEIVLMHAGRIVERAPAATFFSAPQSEHARRFVAGALLI